MPSHLKTLGLVVFIEAIEVFTFYLISWTGLGSYHALNGVAVIASLTVMVGGVVFSNGLIEKAESPKGTPRVTLDAHVLLLYGVATIFSVMFATGIVESLKNGAYIYPLVEAATIVILCVLASKGLSAEAMYTSRAKPPSVIYLPIFVIGTALPAMLGILPLWLVASFAVFQFVLLLAFLVSPWSPIAKRSRRAA